MRRPLGEKEDPTVAIVEAVSEATGRDPIEIQPLAEVLDPDALDAVFAGASPANPIGLTFYLDGCRVSVDEDTIDVEVL